MVVENCKAAPANKIDDVILLDSLLLLLSINPFSPSSLSSRAYRISFFLQGSDDVLGTVDKAAEENASLDGSEDSCSRNIVATEETANLMTRIRHDYHDHWEWWIFISKSQTYDEFKRNIPEYTCNRATFPSRDKEPLDPMCFPLSNEKLYGRGINSNVREFRDI